MPTDRNKTPQGQQAWPFPETAPGTGQGDGAASGQHAADADVLGDAVPMKPPTSTQGPAANGAAAGKEEAAAPGPAEDENHPGFMGERNSPHAA
jgi:hypothetical protein